MTDYNELRTLLEETDKVVTKRLHERIHLLDACKVAHDTLVMCGLDNQTVRNTIKQLREVIQEAEGAAQS